MVQSRDRAVDGTFLLSVSAFCLAKTAHITATKHGDPSQRTAAAMDRRGANAASATDIRIDGRRRGHTTSRSLHRTTMSSASPAMRSERRRRLFRQWLLAASSHALSEHDRFRQVRQLPRSARRERRARRDSRRCSPKREPNLCFGCHDGSKAPTSATSSPSRTGTGCRRHGTGTCSAPTATTLTLRRRRRPPRRLPHRGDERRRRHGAALHVPPRRRSVDARTNTRSASSATRLDVTTVGADRFRARHESGQPFVSPDPGGRKEPEDRSQRVRQRLWRRQHHHLYRHVTAPTTRSSQGRTARRISTCSGNSPARPSKDDICFSCHSYDVYGNAASSPETQRASRFNGGHRHAFHVGLAERHLRVCHETHGNPRLPFLIARIASRHHRLHADAHGGTCTSSCHAPRDLHHHLPEMKRALLCRPPYCARPQARRRTTSRRALSLDTRTTTSALARHERFPADLRPSSVEGADHHVARAALLPWRRFPREAQGISNQLDHTRQLQPGGEILINTLNLHARARTEYFDTSTHFGPSTAPAASTALPASSVWDPTGLPTFLVNGQRNSTSDSASALKLTDENLYGSAQYEWRGLHAGGGERYARSTDPFAGFDRRTSTHEATLGYSATGFGGKLSVVTDGNAQRMKIDERSVGGKTSSVPTPVPIARASYGVDDTPSDDRDHPLSPYPLLTDGNIDASRRDLPLSRRRLVPEHRARPREPEPRRRGSDHRARPGRQSAAQRRRPGAVGPLHERGRRLWTPQSSQTTFNAPLSLYSVTFDQTAGRWFKVVSFGVNAEQTLVTEVQAYYHTAIGESAAPTERRASIPASQPSPCSR